MKDLEVCTTMLNHLLPGYWEIRRAADISVLHFIYSPLDFPAERFMVSVTDLLWTHGHEADILRVVADRVRAEVGAKRMLQEPFDPPTQSPLWDLLTAKLLA